MKKILVTGSLGLIGSEVCDFFLKHRWVVTGIDNNQRRVFFGEQGDTTTSLKRLAQNQNYNHISNLDIRDRNRIIRLINKVKPDAIVHTAAQPSHDKAASILFDDFDINATGTLNLLEATRKYSTNIPFVHLSTNKVYGDLPNKIELLETDKRYLFKEKKFKNGISETFSIDQSKHSLFGASKLAADILVQEYGRYFNMPTVCLRGGCLTGPNHAGVELHGFLNYLIKCNVKNIKYYIYGYKGKQVRDNIHSYDVANFINHFIENPKYGEVYNIGGGKENSISILEAFDLVEKITEKKMNFEYLNQSRVGDHICYYSSLEKIKKHYPNWTISKNLETIFNEIIESYK